MKLLTGTILLAAFLGLCTAASLALGSFTFGDPTEFHWATLDENGQSTIECKAEVLDQAIIEPDAVTRFAVEAVVNVNWFNYLSWDVTVPAALDAYFDPAAARVYLAEFQQSSTLRVMQRSFYASTAISTFPAIITDEDRTFSGSRKWTVQVPATLVYSTEGAEDGRAIVQQTLHFVYTVTLAEQSPTPDNFRGIAVIGMTAKKVSGQREFFRLNKDAQL